MTHNITKDKAVEHRREEEERRQEEKKDRAFQRYAKLAFDVLDTFEFAEDLNNRQRKLELLTQATPGFPIYKPFYIYIDIPKCDYMDHFAIEHGERRLKDQKEQYKAQKRIFEINQKAWIDFYANIYPF